MKEAYYPREYNWKGGATHGIIAPIIGYAISKGVEMVGIPVNEALRPVLMLCTTFGFGLTYALLCETQIFLHNFKNSLKS